MSYAGGTNDGNQLGKWGPCPAGGEHEWTVNPIKPGTLYCRKCNTQ